MERTDALIPLSHEHHQALFIAQRLRREEGPEVLVALADFWRDDGAAHFLIEEEVLIPGSGLPGPEDDDDVARLFEDHRQIRRQVANVLGGDASADQQRALGTALADHVRFEERELFPRIEAALDADQLARLGQEIQAAEAGK
jgi:hypothetical protein